MERENLVAQQIKTQLIAKLQAEFGFCGVMENDDFIMLNSGKDKDLVIKINIK